LEEKVTGGLGMTSTGRGLQKIKKWTKPVIWGDILPPMLIVEEAFPVYQGWNQEKMEG